jgi:predicted HD phosphohydrolase
MDDASPNRTVAFIAMKDGTREDYALLHANERAFAAGQAERVLDAMRQLDNSYGGYKVSRLTHSLQSATRAERDGADDELVLGALLHDIGDVLAPHNHSEVATAILRPFVRPEVTWIVEKHGLFQLYYYGHHVGLNQHAREVLRGHKWFDACADFCERYDQSCFEPDYPTKPLEHFAPLVRAVLGRPARDPQFVQAGT